MMRTSVISRAILCIALASLSLTLFQPVTLGQQEAIQPPEKYIVLRQGDFCKVIRPLAGDMPFEEFYSYSKFEAHTNLEEGREGHSLLFLYKYKRLLSLFVIHVGQERSGGRARFHFSGLPKGVKYLERDEPPWDWARWTGDLRDSYSLELPEAEIRWGWSPGKTDGVVIGDFWQEQLEQGIIITPEFISGIKGWELLSGPSYEQPETICRPELEKTTCLGMNEPVTIGLQKAPEADFSFEPERPQPDEWRYTVQFNASSSKGNIRRYDWYLGEVKEENRIGTGKILIYTFQEPGAHKVILRVTDNCGITDDYSKRIIPRAVTFKRAITTFPPDEPGEPGKILPGFPFEVMVKVEVNLDLADMELREEFPEGWKVREVKVDGEEERLDGNAIYHVWYNGIKAKEDEKFKEIKVVYQAVIPLEIQTPSEEMVVSGHISVYSPVVPGNGEFSIDRKEREVKVVENLPIKVVMAGIEEVDLEGCQKELEDLKEWGATEKYKIIRWDEDDIACYTIRFQPPGRWMINEEQLKLAEKFFDYREKIKVPWTGKPMDWETLKELIRYYSKGKPVTEELPNPDSDSMESQDSGDPEPKAVDALPGPGP